MKHIFILFALTSCYYNDLECKNQIELRKINTDIREQQKTIDYLYSQPMTEDNIAQLSDELDSLDELILEKIILENSPCE